MYVYIIYMISKDLLRIGTDGELHETSLRTTDYNNNNGYIKKCKLCPIYTQCQHWPTVYGHLAVR